MITMTEEKYIEYISEEPSQVQTSEPGADGQTYRYIKKSHLQQELLTLYRGYTKWKMLRDSVTNKGMWGTGLLKYKHPATGEWLYVTGTASKAHDEGMRTNYPTLEANCFVNACKKIGVRFGQTLNVDQEDKETEAEAPAHQKKLLGGRLKPDIDIMRKFTSAIAKGDAAAISMLTNTYEIKYDEGMPVI